MFQTEIHLWLQSFDSPVLRLFMQAISFFGDENFYTLLIVVLLFGIDKRRGFIVMQVMLWTGIVTGALKDFFALPRPVDVDRLVADLAGDQKYDAPFTGRGAATFFGSLPADVIAYYRNVSHVSYGFPSGHCSSSVATWGALALLFRRSWLIYVTLALFVLMPISRMYLGRHFLADVIGGLALGLVAVTLVGVMQRRWMVAGKFVWEHPREHETSKTEHKTSLGTWKWYLFLFVLPLVPMILSESASPNAAVLLGLNAGYIVTKELRRLEGHRGLWKRVLTVVLAAALTALLIVLLNFINTTLQLPLTKALTLAQQTVLGALVVMLTYWLARLFRLDATSLK